MKLALTYVVLLLVIAIGGFLSYGMLKRGVIWDRTHRIATRRKESPRLFWTYWGMGSLIWIGGLSAIAVITYLEFFV